MSNRIPPKIIELRNEIYKDIYDSNRWIYVKMQALLEFVNRQYLSNSYRKSIDYKSNKELTLIIISELGFGMKTKEVFMKIIHNANYVKHDANNQIKKGTNYDSKLVSLFIDEFNNYCQKLFGVEGRLYQLEKDLSSDWKISKPRMEPKPLATKSVIEEERPKIRISLNRDYKKEKPKENDIEIDSAPKGLYISIRSGAGKHDFGFEIHNVSFSNPCNLDNASVFAVIYNMLQRSDNAKKTEFVKKLESKEKIIRNYKNIYRYEILLLVMLKNNYFNDNKLNVNTYDGDLKELKIAIKEINWFARIITTLMNIDYEPLVLVDSVEAYSISINGDETATIYSIDTYERYDGKKAIWLENSIRYEASATPDAIEYLEYLLFEFFGYREYKKGQLEALIELLNGDDNSITILPTGGGKSILFYFMALLQPKPTIVVFPTEILIKDQIRNLKELHDFDDVINFDDELWYAKFDSSKENPIDCGKLLIFVTPEKLQHRNVIMPLISRNVDRQIANIVLDEIHTISNWSHDFRPDYLMLSFNLLNHLDNTRYLGFTATANYRVLKDVAEQLGIAYENIISPIDLRRNNIEFEFLQCANEEEMYCSFNTRIEKKYKKPDSNLKTIVFTKGEAVSENLKYSSKDNIKWNMDIFNSHESLSYESFVEGRKQILACEQEMGVGINIPMVKNVFHYGIPTSKGQYVQEIGRVDRFGEGGKSIVIYKPRKNMNRYEKTIIDFNTSIDLILSILKILDDNNDLKLSFNKIIGHVEHYSIMASGINDFYEQLVNVENYLRISIEIDKHARILKQQVYMFFLYKMGIIHNWYIVDKNRHNVVYDIEVEEGHNDLIHVKRCSIEYISSLGISSKEIHSIGEARTIKEIIFIVQTWYYNQFLRYHREQLLNMIDFFEINSIQRASNENIIEQLSDYFTGTLTSAGENEKRQVASMTIREMIETTSDSPNVILNSQIERILENEYIGKLDIYVCIYQIILSRHMNASRIERALSSLNNSTLNDFMDNAYLLYSHLRDDHDRLEFARILAKFRTFEGIIENLFSRIPRDRLYYAYLSKLLNGQIEKLKGAIAICSVKLRKCQKKLIHSEQTWWG